MDTVVYIADASVLEDAGLYSRLYDEAPQYRRDKIDQVRFQLDKRLSLAAWSLLSLALKKQGMDASLLTVHRGEYDKPFFMELPEYHFNLSHSGERAICAVSDFEIGCDVERVKDRSSGIAERFFHQTEKEHLLSVTDERRTEEFCRIWTLKESYLKCIGRGLNMHMDSFGILFDADDSPYLPHSGLRFFEYDPRDGHRYSCCVSELAGKVTFEYVDLKIQVC